MNRSILLTFALMMFMVFLPGCLTVRETYEGYPTEQVWTAMRTVAESPERDDWHILENQVWVSPDEARLEVYRLNRRTLYRPGSRPLDEEREWKFQIILEQTDPPVAAFRTRSAAVPAHARLEAERFFADVWRMLGGRPDANATEEAVDAGERSDAITVYDD